MTWMQWAGLLLLIGRALLAAAGRYRASPGRGETGDPEGEPSEASRDGRILNRRKGGR